MERHHGDLDGEADEESQKDPPRDFSPGGTGVGGQNRGQDAHIECILPDVKVDGQDTQEHQDRSGQGVKEELDGGIQPARSTPDADKEVHGDQHHFPEHIEEEEIQAAKDTQHAGLQQQEEDVVFLDPLVDGAPRTEDGNESQQCCEKNQKSRDPVHSEDVARPDGRDPLQVFHEIEGTPTREQARCIFGRGEEERQRDQQIHAGHQGGEIGDGCLLRLWKRHDDQRTHKRYEGDS